MTHSSDDMAVFAAALRDLALALGLSAPVTSERVESYWDGLSDLPIEAIRTGIAAAKRDAKRWLPSVGTLREHIRLAQQQATSTAAGPSAMAAGMLARGERYCLDCHDTGWQYIERPMPPGRHEAYRADAMRTTVTPCSCRGLNPIYQHHRGQERRQSAAGGES